MVEKGFEGVGLDLAPTAVSMAEAKAAAAGVEARFVAADILTDELPGGPFDFVYDRGCFHVFDEPEDRARFAARLAGVLAPEGLWCSVIGSTDGPPRDHGPPRRSARQVTEAVEPSLEVVELRATKLHPEDHPGVMAWVLVARPRRG